MAAQPEDAFIRAGTAPGVRRTASGAHAASFPTDVPSDRDALDRFPGRGQAGGILAGLAIDGTTEHPIIPFSALAVCGSDSPKVI
ncbi:hypothetical protein ABZ553_04030 [Streptomyces sparsogenes]|uniref:hypothetical protein n=1 Tax=Streptomyces sparsogenes TaxID=67365 RepID=UPI0033DEF612